MAKFMQAPTVMATAPLPPIGSRRAYGEVIGLFLVVFGLDVINAVVAGWIAVFGLSPGWLTWSDHWAPNIGRAIFVVGVLWLIRLRPWDAIGPRACVAMLTAVVGLKAAPIALVHQPLTVAVLLDHLADTGVAAALGGMLAYRRGLTLAAFGLGRVSTCDRRGAFGTAVLVFLASFLAIDTVSVITQFLNTLSGFPSVRGGFAVNGIHEILTVIIFSIDADDLVLTATVVTALEAARRPVWQIFVTGMVMRLALNVVVGVNAPGALILAAVNIWLFRRTRRLMPLIAAPVLVVLSAPLRMLGGPLALPIIVAALVIVCAAITRRNAPLTKRESTEQEIKYEY